MFSEGQTIVYRGLHQDGRVGGRMRRVLRDDADGLVTWIGPRFCGHPPSDGLR